VKVLFVENAGNKSAGAFHSLIGLILQLRKYNVESYVAVSDKADGLDLLEANSIPYIALRACAYTWVISNNASLVEKTKMPLKYLYVYLHRKELIKYARDNNIDVIHENTSACYIGKYVADSLEIPHIWHIREFLEEDFGVKVWCHKNFINKLNSSTALIAISNAVADKYSQLTSAKIYTIYNGIAVDAFYSDSHKINLCSQSKLLCVGRICQGKGQKEVIQAVAEIYQNNNIKLNVTFAGIYNQDYVEELLDIARNAGISDCVHFIGQCNEMSNLYKKHDILCMASHKEAFGRVTIEAMLAGELVIGANSGGTAEIITNGENGYLYDVGDYQDLAKIILYSIENKEEAYEVAKRGQRMAISEYDAATNAKKIYELYSALLTESADRRQNE